jgi:phosphoribosylformylglycinamidine synthase I
MKKKTVKVIVMSGYGLNCEEETKFAFESAGGKADIVHINDLIENPKLLAGYDILAFPGGFSYGDDTGSGKAYANKMKNHLQKELDEFIARDTLVIGICNGFQIITNLGLVPGALAHNASAMYIDRWVDMECIGKGPWLKGIKKISLPIAHGEGRYVVNENEYKKLQKNKQIAFKYVKGEMCEFQNLKANPNGAMHDVAGVLSENGKILGLMPHPERGMFFHHRPDFQLKKEIAKRKKHKLPEEGMGMLLFKNAIKYFK